MNWFADRALKVIGVVAGALLVAAVGRAQELLPVENIRLPLEHYANGAVKRQLQAGTAIIPPEGPIQAKDVRVETFDEDGNLEMVLNAQTCTYDRTSGTASSKDRLKAETADVVITGKGFTWSSVDQQVVILSDARVEFKRTISKTGRKP